MSIHKIFEGELCVWFWTTFLLQFLFPKKCSGHKNITEYYRICIFYFFEDTGKQQLSFKYLVNLRFIPKVISKSINVADDTF